jgi:SAM-dependent methyltransferase
MNGWYREDLAYIHDVGFRSYVLQAMPGVLAVLQQQNILTNLVVDLGCGSGLSSEELIKAGYRVLGVDISAAMIAIARRRVPQAEFQIASLFDVKIPRCRAVLAIGECLNYLFDSEHQTLMPLFQRIYDALEAGGVFVFDIAEPGQVTSTTPIKTFTEGEDWFVLVEKQENPEQQILTRRIISLRQMGSDYRRDDEVHQQRLYAAETIVDMLQHVGFAVETQPRYGEFALPSAHAAFMARKTHT